MKNRAEVEREKDKPRARSAVVAKVLAHPLRVRILVRMNGPARPLSPKEFAEESGEPLGNVAYHFRVLHRFDFIEEKATAKRRGAVEHFFVAARRSMAWSSEWESLGPAVRQTLAASALRTFVEKAGESIDAGTFEDPPESHLAWDTTWLDEEGWDRMQTLILGTLEEALAIAAAAEGRLGETDPARSPDWRLVTYMLSSFHSPAPPAGGGPE